MASTRFMSFSFPPFFLPPFFPAYDDEQREAKGQFLLDHCFKYLNLTETDFFGLRFTDSHKQKVRHRCSLLPCVLRANCFLARES